MLIGLLGGTGTEGKGLALRFAASGAEVVIGSRSRERALAAADECNGRLGTRLIHGTTNEEMIAGTQTVFLTVPFEQAVAAVSAYHGSFRSGTILVDATVPVRFVDGLPTYAQPEAGSGAELVARHVPPGVSVVGAFKEIPAHVLAEVETPLDCDVLICGDSREARETVMAAASLIPSLRPLDAGPLRMASVIEHMTVLAIYLNRRYRRKGARFRVQGV